MQRQQLIIMWPQDAVELLLPHLHTEVQAGNTSIIFWEWGVQVQNLMKYVINIFK